MKLNEMKYAGMMSHVPRLSVVLQSTYLIKVCWAISTKQSHGGPYHHDAGARNCAW